MKIYRAIVFTIFSVTPISTVYAGQNCTPWNQKTIIKPG